MTFHRAIAKFLFTFLAVSFATSCLHAAPVTGWLKDTSFGGGTAAVLSNAGGNAPILGNGTANNADNTAIYAAFPLASLTNGQRITLTGSAEMIGTNSTGDFRWGLFKDDGALPATGGWLGYMASAESIVWSKNPAGDAFANTTFASVAGGRGTEIGQTSEPNNAIFTPAVYDFSMTVDRFGDEIAVRVGIASDASGYSIVSQAFQESDPARLTFGFDRVGLLAGSALDADQVRFSGIDVTTSSIEAPTLQVRSDGLVFIANAFTHTFDLTAYEITSSSGSLNVSDWNSLDDQEGSGPMDPIGNGWNEAGGSNPNVLSEVNLLSTSPLGDGQSLNLGHAFTPGGMQDLAFRFTTADGNVLRGPVEYILSGDFNGDDHVDGVDLSLWKAGFGTTGMATHMDGDSDGDLDVDGADFLTWQGELGAGVASLPAAFGVPEPAGGLLAALAMGALPAIRRRRGRNQETGVDRGRDPREVAITRRSAVTARQVIACCLLLVAAAPQAASQEINQVAGDLITFNTNGAWSWYMDERVVVDAAAGKLLLSSVADVSGTDGAARNGDVDVVSYDLNSGQIDQFTLHAALQADDHNAAAILVRPDGRYLTMYTAHNSDKLSRYRISTNPHDATSWGPEQTFNWAATPGSDFNVTYSNLFYLADEDRTYNLARANNRSPNMMISNNEGDSWTYGGKLFNTPVNVGYVNGYFKYASNGADRIDFIATEHHPRDFNNSIYHGYIQGGQMFRSDGSVIDGNIFDNAAPNQAALTTVFASDPENGSQTYTRAWTTDLHVDGDGNPYAIFTTRADDVPVNTNGYNDHRFFYARYDGSQWNVNELAKAGARLYGSEQDYTGLIALDPHDPDMLYMSTTIDPRDETNLGVHEIFKGETADGGATWSWTPITANSQVDNLRPIVPLWDDEHTALVWMRGTYTTQQNYHLDIVGLTEFGPLDGLLLGDLNDDSMIDLDDFGIFVNAMNTDLSGLTPQQAYALGDLNGDSRNDIYDFPIFRQAYDNAHGLGAFNAAVARIPEPSSLALQLLAATCLALKRSR
jgi:hypothetical protein